MSQHSPSKLCNLEKADHKEWSAWDGVFDLPPVRSSEMMLQIGDSNARIQSAASDTIIYLADLKSSGLFSIAASLVAVQK